MPPDISPVLYVSLSKEGALAEMSFRQSRLNPIPSKPILLHRLEVDLKRVVRITFEDLERLGISAAAYHSLSYARTQEIGDAACFLNFDGAIVPSARWRCENLVIFEENIKMSPGFTALDSEEIDWKPWAEKNGFLQ